MDFRLKMQVPFPMGLQQETALCAQELVERYFDFFTWVQEGCPNPVEEMELQKNESTEEAQNNRGETLNQKWLLSKWDIEYFYGLIRPADVGCACPFGWMEKVEGVVDQQYPIFGAERFPDLFDKAAHMAWLIIKNQIFPDYNDGIAVLAVFVLLGRNEIALNPKEQDLKSFVALIHSWIKKSDREQEYEDAAIKKLGNLISAWGRL